MALYEWRQPNYPEDLCLLRQDRSPWLVSIAHENDSYLCLSSGKEKEDIIINVPELGPLTIRKHEGE
jgi:hypothetical protein